MFWQLWVYALIRYFQQTDFSWQETMKTGKVIKGKDILRKSWN